MVVATGCGSVGRVTTGDASRGKEIFLSPKAQCASCHTLADAKSTGTIGPNLDDAFASDKAQGFSEQTIRDVIRGQIAYPEEPMPANLVVGQDANDVSVYVAKCAANPNCGVTSAHPAAGRVRRRRRPAADRPAAARSQTASRSSPRRAAAGATR